jgi:hypothetical protein
MVRRTCDSVCPMIRLASTRFPDTRRRRPLRPREPWEIPAHRVPSFADGETGRPWVGSSCMDA